MDGLNILKIFYKHFNILLKSLFVLKLYMYVEKKSYQKYLCFIKIL